MTRLTILTQPTGFTLLLKKLKAIVSFIKNKILQKKVFTPKQFGGPIAVKESLIKGLNKLNINFNYNPKYMRDINNTVVVLSGIDALKQAIKLKRKGKIKKLLAGPNLVVLPREHNRILGAKEIDVCIVPSEWVKIAYEEDEPNLIGKIKIWPVGIDEVFWMPQSKKTNNVLIYEKACSKNIVSAVKKILSKYNHNIIHIKYNSHTQETFKTILDKSSLAIFLSNVESQGIALTESWAMNVPTIVFNPQELTIYDKQYSSVSSCPYLTKQTGADWKTLSEFENIIKNIDSFIDQFSPRKWVLEHMTNKICAKNLLAIIKSNQ
jgi:hypothetical protein